MVICQYLSNVTKDILKYLGEHKTSQYLIGFAAETEDIENYAQQNYARKMQMDYFK